MQEAKWFLISDVIETISGCGKFIMAPRSIQDLSSDFESKTINCDDLVFSKGSMGPNAVIPKKGVRYPSFPHGNLTMESIVDVRALHIRKGERGVSTSLGLSKDLLDPATNRGLSYDKGMAAVEAELYKFSGVPNKNLSSKPCHPMPTKLGPWSC